MRYLRIVIISSVCFLFMTASVVRAQDTAPVTKSKKAKKVASDEMTYSAGIAVGSSGVGADFILRVDRHFGVRMGLSYLPNVNYKMENQFSFGDIKANVAVGTRDFSNFHIMFDYFPFQTSGFRLTGGFGYFNQSTAEATVTPVGDYQFNDYPVTNAQIGTATGSLTWESGLAPYGGAGFVFGANNGKKLHLSLDLGTYYMSSPYAAISGTKLLAQNSINQAQFATNTKEYRWLPVLQLGLSYKF